MVSSLITHLRQQWMGALALFLVLTAGVAYAAGTITSSDIANNEIRSVDVRNERSGGGLTGADIRNQSGVDTCTHGTVRLGELCFRASAAAPQSWYSAIGTCGSLRLRLPTFGEAVVLATSFNLPGIADQEMFWTDEYYGTQTGGRVMGVNDGGASLDSSVDSTYETVCVTTPTN